MTPQEKAKELYDKMYSINRDEFISIHASKNAALIAVDEILNVIPNEYLDVWQGETYMAINEDIAYWQRVKQEIEKL